MGIKKEITAAMRADTNTSIQLNDIARLDVMKKDGLDNDCDIIRICFSYVGGIRGGRVYDIEAREYDKMLGEIDKKTKWYLSECAEALNRNLINGVR